MTIIAAAADLHPDDALDEARDHPDERKVDRLAPLARPAAVEFLAVREVDPEATHAHGVGQRCLGPGADRQVVVSAAWSGRVGCPGPTAGP